MERDFIYIYLFGKTTNGPGESALDMTFEIVALVAAFGAIALVALSTVLTGSPPTPSSPRVRRTVLGCLPARLPGPPGGAVYELGAGWGGLGRALASRYPDNPVTGYEISPLPWLASRLAGLILRRPNLRLAYGDFRGAALSDAALVVCYLSADALAALRPKLDRELRPGALVVSCTFPVPGWDPLDSVAANDIYRSPVYLYEASGAAAEASHDAVSGSTSGDSDSATRA